MEKKNKVLIKINGQEYPIVGAEPKEYLLRVGSYVDERMAEVAQGNKRLSTSMIAVLTSINITDQLLKLQEAYRELHQQQSIPMKELEKTQEELERSVALLAEKEEANKLLTEKLEHYSLMRNQQENYDEIVKKLEEKEKDLKKAEEIINDLQNKLFESQIKLVETKRQMEELLKENG
ncbi:cell division protein ZapA [Alkaliphilus hydrothermalis]|uniref:Cell division protein ZapA n=1 Tax=Alkaliphilus hydrothermalis TaxID=1482730 RepID=A0ABS2NSK7_9FIRM|nr:cell division protein ZapA [Alkaliphilus hydrothermalis]MBM7615933.1 cell division protein ZapA [Alkaliphilus hydrothermalis]